MEIILEDMAPQNTEFSALTIKRKTISSDRLGKYRVYTSRNEYLTVDATSAYEAFKASGVKEAVRILRDSKHLETMLDQNWFAPASPQAEEATTTLDIPPPMPVEKTTRIPHPPETGARAIDPETIEHLMAMSLQSVDPNMDGIEEILPSAGGSAVAGFVREEIAMPASPTESLEKTIMNAQVVDAPAGQGDSPARELSPEEVSKLLSGDSQ